MLRNTYHLKGTLMRRALLALAAGACASLAQGAEIVVMSGGAVKSPMEAIGQAYAKETGHVVRFDFATAGELRKKLAAGERADVLIMPAENLDALEREGRIVPGTRTALGKVGIGVAVNASAPSPDISSPDAFKRTLLAAKSIVYVDPERGTSGKHFAQVLVDLGIAEAVKAKTTLGPGGYVVAPVGRGEIELGVHQISEILPVPGVKLVGPLPDPLQKWTVYTAVLMTGAPSADAAQAFVRYATGPGRAEFLRRGFSAPE
jgi:molybdate transport system substrate-binding protein